MTHSHDTATPALSVEGAERSDYLSDPQARELWGTEDDEALPDGHVRVCEGEWVRIPGGYYFDGSAGLLHPESASEACDGCEVTIAAAPAPNPSPAAKGGEAVLEWETCKPLTGNYAEEAYTSFGYFRVERFAKSDHLQLTGPGLDMRWDQGVDSGKAAVEEYFVSILRGYAPLLAALATPSPQQADAVREALPREPSQDILDAIVQNTRASVGYADARDIYDAIRAALASDPAPAGEAVEPAVWGVYVSSDGRYTDLSSDSEDGARQIAEEYFSFDFEIRPLYAHPAPEDTARLREDLERVTRELAEENQNAQSLASDLSGLMEDFSKCQRERDDARKALETAAEDERDRLYEIAHNYVRSGVDSFDPAHEFLREYAKAMLPVDRAATRSASREGASDE